MDETPTLGERFPHLRRSPDTRDDFREDLARTDVEFGRKWRRHKSARLAELQLHEDQLELADRRRFLDRIQPVVDLLAEVSTGVATGGIAPGGDLLLDAIGRDVVDHGSAEAAYALATIRLRPELSVGDHGYGAVRSDLLGLGLDQVGVDVLRESVCALTRPATDTLLAERHGIAKQSIAERRRRLVDRLLQMGDRRPFASLCEVIVDRMDRRGERPRLRLDDPLARIALLRGRDFPDLSDAVAVGIWLASGDGVDGRRPGFQRSDDGLVRR